MKFLCFLGKKENEDDDDNDSDSQDDQGPDGDACGSVVELCENEDKGKIEGGANKAKKKKKFTFPWWCIIIAWMLTICCIGVSLFFLWAYGITFGNEKTTQWFTSLIISTLCSIFLTQPLKVIILALVFSMVCKDLDQDEDDADEDEEDPRLANDEEWLHAEISNLNINSLRMLFSPTSHYFVFAIDFG